MTSFINPGTHRFKVTVFTLLVVPAENEGFGHGGPLNDVYSRL